MIQFDKVSLEYQPGRFALRDVSFSMAPGSFTFLTGHSGAGKSSLLKLIACLERPTAGEIHIGNIAYSSLKPRQEPALRQQMGIVFQDNQLLSLSGGEQQRVGIARAVVARPKLLLADEPTGNLDADISADIMHLLMQFNASGVTVLFATHDESLLQTFQYPQLTLQQGRMVHSSQRSTARVIRRQATAREQSL